MFLIENARGAYRIYIDTKSKIGVCIFTLQCIMSENVKTWRDVNVAFSSYSQSTLSIFEIKYEIYYGDVSTTALQVR
jgi:hypothetical protein